MRAWALVLAIAGLVAGAAAARPVDGELLASQPCPPRAQTYDEYVAAMVKAEREEAELAAQAGVPAPSAADLPDVLITRDEYDAELKAPPRCEQISYGSDGLRVAGLVWKPADAKPGANLPAIVMLRGGNRDFGKFRPDSQRRMHALVSAGFVVVGVQYRGVDGGEGLEQFGGDDVRDVLNAIKLARGLPEVDARNVFLHAARAAG